MKKRTAAISCICLCALLGLGAWQGGMFDSDPAPIEGLDATGIDGIGIGNVEEAQTDDGDIIPDDAVISEHNSGKEQEKAQITAENDTSEGSVAPAVSSDTPVQNSDAPVQNEVGGTGALQTLDTVWGGSYIDENGNWVVWLTEDTPENRAAVFAANPTITESSTVFRKADYSLAYLTQLMADISRAMGNGSLSFVTSAALREDINRVSVTMTSDDADAAAKVLAFDPLGGAIEVVSGSTAVQE